MILEFTSTHIETIHDLHELAKKHNCKISITVGGENITPDEYHDYIFDLLKKEEDMTDRIEKGIKCNYEIIEEFYRQHVVCFDLIDMNDKEHWKHNTMQYVVRNLYFCFKENTSVISFPYSYRDKDEDVEIEEDEYMEISEEADKWLNSHTEYDGFYSHFSTDTLVYGFENQDTKVDVYREGMALKFFGDLVCDYLGEERIVRTY